MRIIDVGVHSDLVECLDKGFIKEVLQSAMSGKPLADRAWKIAYLSTAMGGLGVTYLAYFTDAVFVASYINLSMRAPLLYSRALEFALLDYVPEARLNEPVEAALVRITSLAHMVCSNNSVPDLDANLQARMVREIHPARKHGGARHALCA